jgi:hypothetical protein
MIFSLVVALMVILIAAFWAYQGFFSSIIMFFEAVVALMTAFAFFEQVHGLWAGSIGPGIGLPLAFMLLFLATLVLTRVLTDKLIPGNVVFPLSMERAGGAVCGFFTGMILVGAALIAIQMLPIGSSVLGFERLQGGDQGPPTGKNFLLKPDAFVVGLANMLSDDRFGGGNPLAYAKPDYLMDLYSVRATPQTEARHVIPEDSLEVVSYWDGRQIDHVAQKAPIVDLIREFSSHPPANSLNKFLVCKVRLKLSAAHPDKPGEIRFRVPQFRLVGPSPAKVPSRRPRIQLACGMSDIYIHKQHAWGEVGDDQHLRLVRFSPFTDFILSPAASKAVSRSAGPGGESYEFDVAFEVPEEFEPWYLEFKRGARVEISKNMRLEGPPAAPGQSLSPLQSSSGDVKVGAPSKGQIHLANAIEDRTGATAVLPMPLDRSQALVARHLHRGKLNEGHFHVVVADGQIDPGSEVKEFFVPPGKRMVQIGAEPTNPQNVLSKALGFAVQTVGQIIVRSADGRTYFAQGVYSRAPIGGQVVFEIQYWPNTQMPERCLRKPLKLTPNIMRNTRPSERQFGYIFLVDPGVKIVSFSSGQRDRAFQRINIQVPP